MATYCRLHLLVAMVFTIPVRTLASRFPFMIIILPLDILSLFLMLIIFLIAPLVHRALGQQSPTLDDLTIDLGAQSEAAAEHSFSSGSCSLCEPGSCIGKMEHPCTYVHLG